MSERLLKQSGEVLGLCLSSWQQWLLCYPLKWSLGHSKQQGWHKRRAAGCRVDGPSAKATRVPQKNLKTVP